MKIEYVVLRIKWTSADEIEHQLNSWGHQGWHLVGQSHDGNEILYTLERKLR